MSQDLRTLGEAILKTAVNDYKFAHGLVRQSAENFLFPNSENSMEHFTLVCDMAEINRAWLHEQLLKMRSQLRGKRYYETQNSALIRRRS